MAEDVAKALSLEFYFQGKCADEVKITGYMDAGGTYRTTPFRQAFEFGGVFLFDEIDGWTADAVIAVNAPLAGQWGDFPDGKVARHPDFVAIGAANTYGRGADRQYVGREQLDAATLDRFAVIEVDYDEDLELAISCDADWTRYVQQVRMAIAKEKVRHVVSPRASIGGGLMLAAGEPRQDVEEAYVWKGMEEVVRNRIKASMR
jgi:cobaltochelatase CobS